VAGDAFVCAESEDHVDGPELRAKSGLISSGEATDDN
jgi:hypothetical protein